jgi:hypothetical protein
MIMGLKERFDENKREFLVMILIAVVSLSVFITLKLHINFHEWGHTTVCVFLLGGEARIKQTDVGWETTCYTKYEPTWNQKLLYLMAGAGVELLLSSILLIIPPTTVLGGFMLTHISYSLIKGTYLYDIQHTGEIMPILNMFLNPVIQYLLFFLTILILILSFFYLWWFVKKVDIPFV